jgi:hypothetical protein
MRARRVCADPAKPAGGVPVDPVRHADDDHDRGLGESVRAKVADQLGEIVRRDRVEATRPETVEQMLLDRVAVARLRRGPEVKHRPLQPILGSIG